VWTVRLDGERLGRRALRVHRFRRARRLRFGTGCRPHRATGLPQRPVGSCSPSTVLACRDPGVVGCELIQVQDGSVHDEAVTGRTVVERTLDGRHREVDTAVGQGAAMLVSHISTSPPAGQVTPSPDINAWKSADFCPALTSLHKPAASSSRRRSSKMVTERMMPKSVAQAQVHRGGLWRQGATRRL
jgi:hypothetical protein